jgi:hypothetical protein
MVHWVGREVRKKNGGCNNTTNNEIFLASLFLEFFAWKKNFYHLAEYYCTRELN